MLYLSTSISQLTAHDRVLNRGLYSYWYFVPCLCLFYVAIFRCNVNYLMVSSLLFFSVLSRKENNRKMLKDQLMSLQVGLKIIRGSQA